MKIPMICFVLVLLHCLPSNAQSDSTHSFGCDFLNSIKFENGIAKIEIKATTNEVGKVSDRETLKKIEKQGKIRAKDFTYAVVFHPYGCEKNYYISSRDRGKDALKLFELGGIETTIVITCTVFENYKLWDYPYFVIDKIRIE